jgi:hypothetical protein
LREARGTCCSHRPCCAQCQSGKLHRPRHKTAFSLNRLANSHVPGTSIGDSPGRNL